MDDRSGLAAILDDLNINKNCKECDKCSVHDCDLVGKITLSQKKAPQLYHGGYYYRLTKPNQSGNIKWRCTRRGCKGSCVTLSDTVGTCYNVQIKNDCHINAPDPIKIEELEYRRKLKRKAEQCINEKPRSIITNINQTNISEEAIANSGSYNAYRQLVHREIQIHQPDYPPKPQSLADIVIPDWLTHTIKEQVGDIELFLLHDSGKEDPDRFFIFSTDRNIKHLEDMHIFADGTFDVAPDLMMVILPNNLVTLKLNHSFEFSKCIQYTL
jgi:hypothetical protein